MMNRKTKRIQMVTVTAATISLLATGLIPASAAPLPADTAAPVVTIKASTIPTTVKLAGADQKISFTATIKDASGIRTPRVFATHSPHDYRSDDVYRDWQHEADMTKASGSSQNGTWTSTFSVPRGLSDGEVWVYLDVRDILGNSHEEVEDVASFRVLSSPQGVDITPPKVSLVSISKKTLDSSTGKDTLEARFKLVDSSGIDLGKTTSRLKPEVSAVMSTAAGPEVKISIPAKLESGSRTSGTWKAVLQAPKGMQPGAYNLRVGNVRDIAGNHANDFLLAKATIKNSGSIDKTGPEVQSTKISAQKINVFDAPAKVTVRQRLTDPAGVETPQLILRNTKTGKNLAEGDHLGIVYGKRESGTLFDGTWVWTYKIPKTTPTGKWEFLAPPPSDKLGNLRLGTHSIESVLGSIQVENFAPKSFTSVPKPALSGTPIVGKTLKVNPGSWNPTGASFKYQWLRDSKPITGATRATYKISTADAGRKISVKVSASKYGYKNATSAASAAKTIAKLKFVKPPTATISGTAKVGKKLTAKAGTWKPAPTLSYQWLRDGKNIKGATRATHALTTSDAGHKISVRVTAKKTGYVTLSKTSAAKTIPKLVLSKTRIPTISGKAKVGQTLKAKTGSWSPTATFKYQWLRDGKTIGKATTSTYKLTRSDQGRKISVKITGSKKGYVSASKTSARTAKVAR